MSIATSEERLAPPTQVSAGTKTPIPPRLQDLTREKATLFLQRATFGGRPQDVDYLMEIGIDAWFEEQFNLDQTEAMLNRFQTNSNTTWNAYWAGPMADPDQLRKRVTYAMSQIFVSSRASSTHRVSHYNDILEQFCFRNFRVLLEAISRSPSMSRYLTFHRNKKADDSKGSVPDENYAREVMQLFTIGLWRLNLGGQRWRSLTPAYTNDDIEGLARVFTGIADFEFGPNDREADLLPLTGDFADSFHETGEKRFLGKVVPAGSSLEFSFGEAMDALSEHPNTAPFVCKQLIQRLVTSNPAPGYVRRVVDVFLDDGEGNCGNMAAVVRAILLDVAAWRWQQPERFGKIREPVLRFTIAARALNIQSDTDSRWRISDLTDDRTALGQQPWFAPSVFNFYRPGYVPPQTELVGASPWREGEGLVAPEMQIVNETSTIGWVNFMADFLRTSPTVSFDTSDLVELIKDTRVVTDAQAKALIDELEIRLCPSGLSDATRELITRALKNAYTDDYLEPGEPNADRNSNQNTRDRTHEDRVIGAIMLVLASTDFIWER